MPFQTKQPQPAVKQENASEDKIERKKNFLDPFEMMEGQARALGVEPPVQRSNKEEEEQEEIQKKEASPKDTEQTESNRSGSFIDPVAMMNAQASVFGITLPPVQRLEDEEEIQKKKSEEQNTEIQPNLGMENALDPMAMMEGQARALGITPAPVQRLVEEEEEIQRKKNTGNSSGPASTSTKTNMPEDVQTKMEGSFGTDFSDVNIHKNDSSATDMGAHAYTQGNNVHFAPGQYDPSSTKGQELIGHELTHVVQQRQGRVQAMAAKLGWGTSNQAATGNTGMAINDSPTLENEADIMGAKAARGDIAHVSGSIGNAVQKDGDDDENYENFDIKVICIILENIYDGDNKVVGMKGEQYIEVIDNGGETKREFIEDINWLEDEIKEGTLVTNEDGSLVEISHDYEMPAEPLIFDVTKPIVTISRQNEPQNEPKVILRFPTDHTEGGIQIHGIGRSEGCILASGDMLELIFNIFKEQNFKPLLGQISLVIDKRSEEERIEASVYYPNNPGYVINENPSEGVLQNLESGFNEWVGFVDYCSFVNFRIDNQMGDEYVIDELKKGTEVKVIGKNGEWLHVEVAFGGSIIRGYIHKNYIRHPIESKFIGKHQTIDKLAEEEGGMEKIIAAIRFTIENPGDESLPDWAQQISEFAESMGLDLMMLSDLTYLIYPFKEPLTSEEEKNRLEGNNKRAIKFIVEKILDYLFNLNEANGEDNNGISLSVSEEEIEIIPELLEDFLSSSDEISSLNKDNFLNEIEAYLSQKEGIDEKYKGLIEEIIRIFVVLQRDIIEKLPELEGASFDIDGNNEIDNEELENMINFYLEVISVLEYKFDYEQGIFFTTPDAHQQHFGYCDLYNEAADEVLNYKIDYFTVPISAKNPEGEDQVYKIRGWKGNYWGAIGGEIGCYTGDLPLLDWAGEEATGASKDFMLEMGFILYDEEFNQIFKRYKEENWWVIGLKPGELELFEDVRTKYTMEGLINFDSYPNLVDGFIQEAPKQGLENISRSGNSVVFTWKEPVNSSGTANQTNDDDTNNNQLEELNFEFVQGKYIKLSVKHGESGILGSREIEFQYEEQSATYLSKQGGDSFVVLTTSNVETIQESSNSLFFGSTNSLYVELRSDFYLFSIPSDSIDELALYGVLCEGMNLGSLIFTIDHNGNIYSISGDYFMDVYSSTESILDILSTIFDLPQLYNIHIVDEGTLLYDAIAILSKNCDNNEVNKKNDDSSEIRKLFDKDVRNESRLDNSDLDWINQLIELDAPLLLQLKEFSFIEENNKYELAYNILTQDDSGQSYEVVIIDELIELFALYPNQVSDFIEYIDSNEVLNCEGLIYNFEESVDNSSETENKTPEEEIINTKAVERLEKYKKFIENELETDVEKIEETVNNENESFEIETLEYCAKEKSGKELYLYFYGNLKDGKRIDFEVGLNPLVRLNISLMIKFKDKWLDFANDFGNNLEALSKFDDDSNLIESWRKLFKANYAISDVLRKDFITLYWVSKNTDSNNTSSIDELLERLKERTIESPFEDDQGRLVLKTESSGKTRLVVTLEKMPDGEVRLFMYKKAYHKFNKEGMPPLSKNGLAPDFSGNEDWLYPIEKCPNRKNIVKIKLSGSRHKDFKRSNEAAGLDKTPTGYTWHHMDDFAPGNEMGEGTSTMQLVVTRVHRQTLPHTGSVKQYENYHLVNYKMDLT